MGAKKGSPVDPIARADLIARTMELRRTGMLHRDIATELGISVRTVYNYITEALKQTVREPTEQVIAIELERLDAMLAGMWSAATNGDAKAVATVVRLMERRAKYTGADLWAAQRVLAHGKDLPAVDEWLKAMLGASGAIPMPEPPADSE